MLRQYLRGYVFPGMPDGSPNRAVIDAALPRLEPQLAVLDKAVARTGHLVGGSFTIADMNLLPILYYMGKVPESTALLGKLPSLQAYVDRHGERASVTETVPPTMPGRRPAA